LMGATGASSGRCFLGCEESGDVEGRVRGISLVGGGDWGKGVSPSRKRMIKEKSGRLGNTRQERR